MGGAIFKVIHAAMARKNIKTRSRKKKAQASLDDGQLTEALALYEKVCELDPRDADAWYMAGVVSGMLGKKSESVVPLARAIELDPGHAMAYYNLGISLRDLGEMERAAVALEKTIELKPGFRGVYSTLANVLISLQRLSEAEQVFRQLLPLEPNVAENFNNLGTVLQAMGRLDEAIENYKQAIRLKPAMSVAWDSLGSAYVSSGRYEEAISTYRESLKLDPRNARAYSNLLLTLNYMEGLSPRQVFDEHRRWGEQYGDRVEAGWADVDCEPGQVLRIGYVSPDLREHSVACFIEPLLEAHDKEKFETFAYSSVPVGDHATARLKSLVSHWRDISGQQDHQVIERIKQDKIHILVDLSGHTACNHLTLFARKPAPLQVTWLGYPNTTGLETMDYRFTDEFADPAGSDEFYTEKLVRLPGSFLCYRPPASVPGVAPLPCIDNGYITLGSFNNLAKMGDGVIALWSELLHEMPQAKLLIKNPSLTDASTRARYLQKFVRQGIDAGRLELMGHTPTRDEHLALYSRVDIALDTFPYNGTTTTCEALWMGVPVVVLAGESHAGRVGVSLLTSTGMQENIAANREAYVQKVVALAADHSRLAALRAGMREKMLGSMLCNQHHFAAQVEQAYNSMWQEFCRTRQ